MMSQQQQQQQQERKQQQRSGNLDNSCPAATNTDAARVPHNSDNLHDERA